METDVLSLDWSSDESYVLEGLERLDTGAATPAGQGVVVARIRAASYFGARHALESLSQLIAHTGNRKETGRPRREDWSASPWRSVDVDH